MKRVVPILAAFAAGWLCAMLLAGTPYAGDIQRVVGPGTLQQLQTPWGLRAAFAPFWESWQLVDAIFYARERIDHARMIRGAIDGMLATLDDKYTFYQEPEKAQQTRDDMAGKTAGIGIYLRITDGRAYAWKPIADAPAVTAGVRHNDEIIRVDSTDVATLIEGLSVDDAATAIAGRIRGPAGTTVTLVVRTGTEPERVVAITRAEIILPSLEWQRLPDDIGYIRISEFKGNTPDAFATALRSLQSSPVRALVLDLRGNPGGLLDSAQRLLGFFYDGTALWEERQAGAPIELRTSRPYPDIPLIDVPVVLLIDANSASASEVMSGALRDRYPRLTIVGTQSFGKGIVQNIYPLSDGGTIRLTISQWLTPAKTRIHGVGLTPDLVVADDPAAAAQSPCVAARLPAQQQTLCRDPQLLAALALLP